MVPCALHTLPERWFFPATFKGRLRAGGAGRGGHFSVCLGGGFSRSRTDEGHLGWVLKDQKGFVRQGGSGSSSPGLQSSLSGLAEKEASGHSLGAFPCDRTSLFAGLDASSLASLGYGVHHCLSQG